MLLTDKSITNTNSNDGQLNEPEDTAVILLEFSTIAIANAGEAQLKIPDGMEVILFFDTSIAINQADEYLNEREDIEVIWLECKSMITINALGQLNASAGMELI